MSIEICGSSEVLPVSKIQISILKPQEVISFWKVVRPYLKPAVDLSNGRWNMEYVLAGLVTGRQNLWVAADEDGKIMAAATTEVVDYPLKRMLTMHFIGGEDFDLWYTLMLNGMSEFAKSAGCEGIECVARMGFWKWFKEDGFKKESTFYERNV